MTETKSDHSLRRPARLIAWSVLLAVAAQAGEPEPLRIHLPFRAGAKFPCDQGNHGPTSHSDGINDYAFDFQMPEGTDVLSAAAGRVVMAIDVHTQGGLETELKKRSNRVWIDHGGGRLTMYEHLQPRSVRVVVGQLVNAGQLLALSGNTGYSSGPHLHFGVTDLHRRTVPSSFLEVRDGQGVPVTNGSYTSANDGVGASWFAADSTVPADWFAKDGVVLSSTFPALYWNWESAVPLHGRLGGDFSAAYFFVSPLDQYGAIASKSLKPGPDRAFEASFRATEFEGPISKAGACQYGLAGVANGKFHCERMLPVVLWRDTVDTSRGPIAPLRLPFRESETFEYQRDPWGGAEPDGVLLAIQAPPKTRVCAAASGRIIVSDPKRPVILRAGEKAQIAAQVTLDHGGGVVTEYVGLEKLAVREGEIVAAGTELGSSAKSPWGKEPHFLFRAHGRTNGRQPRFAELGDLGALAKVGKATSTAAEGDPSVFRADSLADAAEFRALGIANLAGTPAHTFHAGTRYAVSGDAPRSVTEVTFLVRERGAAPSTRAASAKTKSGKFELAVRLGDVAKSVGDGPWEWTLGVPNAGRGDAGRWLPLVIVR